MDKAKGSQTEANDLSGGSQADRGCATSKVGKCEAGGVAAARAIWAPFGGAVLSVPRRARGKNSPTPPTAPGVGRHLVQVHGQAVPVSQHRGASGARDRDREGAIRQAPF